MTGRSPAILFVAGGRLDVSLNPSYDEILGENRDFFIPTSIWHSRTLRFPLEFPKSFEYENDWVP